MRDYIGVGLGFAERQHDKGYSIFWILAIAFFLLLLIIKAYTKT